MKNSLFLKIIFYTLLVAVAVSAGMLINKNFSHAPNANLPNNTNQPATNTPLAQKPTTQSKTDQPQAGNNQIPTPTPPPSRAVCIITIDGNKYDVQPLRSNHPGGDVFVCNTDMSSTFHGQHGQSVKRIEKYLVK